MEIFFYMSPSSPNVDLWEVRRKQGHHLDCQEIHRRKWEGRESVLSIQVWSSRGQSERFRHVFHDEIFFKIAVELKIVSF